MSPGPVSATLADELASEVQKSGVVFFLDKEDNYSGFIDKLAGANDTPYPVLGFRGSYLELLAKLEHHAAGVDPTRLLVHLPGFNEDMVKASPLYEMYAAGKRLRKALDTLVTEAAAGRVRPEQIQAFVAQDGMTLDGADAWLDALSSADKAGLAGQLRAMTVPAIIDDLLANGIIAQSVKTAGEVEVLRQHFATTLGLSEDWRDENERRAHPRPRDLAFTAASWALAVEYTTDLSRPPHDERLQEIHRFPKQVIDASLQLANHLRERQPAFYESTATETATWLTDETDHVHAEDLGRIDTFLFEETAIMKAALDALQSGAFKQALDWAAERSNGKSFWTKQAPLRQNAWLLILDAARLGEAIANAGASLGKVASLDAATERYVEHGASVDQAHRLLKQRRLALLYPQVPFFDVLRTRLDEMRARWRAWADAWAIEWNDVCIAHGFLPSPELQQRTLFDEIVKPLAVDASAPNDVTAYFLVDALRFEMAQELSEAIGVLPATQKQLRPRLAELPSLTEVGMNVLAPVVNNGRLEPALADGKIKGFSAGEYRVSTIETRKRAMFDRVGGKGCPWLTLNEVLNRDHVALRKTVEQARLLVVHSQEIDQAGENGLGASMFDKVLQDLRAAWRLLREAGVRRFVITADHGFLLLDDRLGEAQVHGRKIDPKRRHVFSEVAAEHSGEVRVALSQLGYDGAPGYLMFPKSVTVFDTGGSAQNFVHGGNSPQERVVPVLTLVHKQPAGSDTLSYTVTARALDGIAGMHCIEAQVDASMGSLFGGRKTLELGLRTVDAPPGVVVELCQTRRAARLAGSVIHAELGASFEVFFKLFGSTDIRVRVELCHTGGEANVAGALVDSRFSVSPLGVATEPTGATSLDAPSAKGWLAEFTDAAVRRVFEHLATHGTVTETEAAEMLGGPRELRKFAREFEQHAARAPFRTRIEVVAGIKRYVREGGQG